MLDELSETTLFNKLLQILFGPVLDVNQSDIDKLLSYGLIKPNPGRRPEQSAGKPAYLAFSGYFQSYLFLMGQTIHIWPVLGETERALRDLIATKLQLKYGEEWLNLLRTRCSRNFQGWSENQNKANNTWKDKAPDNILAYAYLRELFEVMFVTEWKEIFEPIFKKDGKKDKAYWNKCADHLAKVRNPFAHNYAEVVSASDREKARTYCEEILELVRPHLESEPSHAQTH